MTGYESLFKYMSRLPWTMTVSNALFAKTTALYTLSPTAATFQDRLRLCATLCVRVCVYAYGCERAPVRVWV